MSTDQPTEQSLVDFIRRTAIRHDGVRVGIGDDCAVLEPTPASALLATTDLLIEDVHFRRRYARPSDIGWKSVAVNLSDIASMGGKPRWALVALACPQGVTTEDAEAFWAGALALASEHGVTVVGGDTVASPHGWAVNVTMLGEVPGAPILRSTARPGDVVAVTGTLGRSAAGLAVLEYADVLRGLSDEARVDVTTAHLRPRPRVNEGLWLAKALGVTAMIDLSDGLATDLGHILTESRVGARVDLSSLPVATCTDTVAKALGRDPVLWATSGGEDYELLLTCAPRVFQSLAADLKNATGTVLSPVGEITAPAVGLRWLDAAGHDVRVSPGFQHFAAGDSRV